MTGHNPRDKRPSRKGACDAGARKHASVERARADVRQDFDAINAFVEAHGSFAEMVREHYATVDGDAPVLTYSTECFGS